MTFDELWERVCATSDLPEGARVQKPASLSDKAKTIIEKKKLSAGKLTHIAVDIIDRINSGSVESKDGLIMKSLEN